MLPTLPLGSSALYTLPNMPPPIRFSWEKLFVYCWRDAIAKNFAKVGGTELLMSGVTLVALRDVPGSTVTFSVVEGGGGGGIEYTCSALISISCSPGFGIVAILCTSFSCSLCGFGLALTVLVSAWWPSFGLGLAQTVLVSAWRPSFGLGASPTGTDIINYHCLNIKGLNLIIIPMSN